MSLHLTLIPFGPDATFSHALLGPIEVDDALQSSIRRVEVESGRDVPFTFNTFMCRDDVHGYHYGNTQETPYGQRLKHVGAWELVNALTRNYSEVEACWMAEPALHYLSHLPESWRVALYWH